MFNEDMDQRLTDLHAAASAGVPVEVRFVSGGDYHMGSMPDRVACRFAPREVVFEVGMARQVADQLEANGFPSLADRIREVAG